MTRTLYDILGVADDASHAEVRRAYRERVKQYHPDVSDHPEAAERFQAIKTAEAVLADRDERARYDRLGHESYLRVIDENDPLEEADVTAGTASSPKGRDDQQDERVTTPAGDSDTPSSAGTHFGWDVEVGPPPGRNNPSRRAYSPWRDDDTQAEADTPSDETESATAGEAKTGRTRRDESASRTDPTGATASGSTGRYTGHSIDFGTGDQRRAAGSDPGGSTDHNRISEVVGGTGHTGAGTRRRRSMSDTGSGFWAADIDTSVPVDDGPDAFREAFVKGDGAVLVLSLLVVYPVFVYFSVSPALPLVGRLLAGLVTAVVAVFLLTEPAVSVVVFGVWSFLAPLLLLFVKASLLSISGLIVLGAFWGPLALALLVLASLR